ncbi:chromate transporter [Acidaminobacter hydrogenoformans]|uniref:Chromate transporter n=1 Tax=Acidaminobacter hydrogenoformans DSM 2784 TaxID=1120920 RepID=A0A1G5S327_9FIRM|nr:chromate transporter [Acidaminobacter hydrogenoformans]SCZ80716.1 chromate transporter [Acidaminobacter hydrogenoformans DSM 2784]
MKLPLILQMALTFFKIGSFSFGGGYAILPVIRHEVVGIHHWLTDREFLNILSISQVTPGPVAINTSTYVGYKMGGILGSAAATVAVVVTCITLSVLLAGRLYPYREHHLLRSVFSALRPIVIALILSAAVSTGLTVEWDWRATLIGAIAFALLTRFKVKVVWVMGLSGVMGAVFYGVLA